MKIEETSSQDFDMQEATSNLATSHHKKYMRYIDTITCALYIKCTYPRQCQGIELPTSKKWAKFDP